MKFKEYIKTKVRKLTPKHGKTKVHKDKSKYNRKPFNKSENFYRDEDNT